MQLYRLAYFADNFLVESRIMPFYVQGDVLRSQKGFKPVPGFNDIVNLFSQGIRIKWF